MTVALGEQVMRGLRQLRWVVSALPILLGSCGGGGGGSSSQGSNNGGNGSQPSIRISIKPETTQLEPQGTQQFAVTVTGTTDVSVSWQVIGGQGSVDANGLYQAPAVKGTYYVQVISGADPSVTAEAIISVPNSTGNGTIGIH